MHFKGFFNKGVLGKAVSETADARNAKHAGQRCVVNGNKLPQTLTQSQPSSWRMRGSRANNTASFVGDIFPNKRALSQCRYDSALGRSMIEMLGVLAIIGVLSIAAVAGYRFALLKFRANEVINELNMRAINVSAQMLNTGAVYEKNELIEDGFGDTLTVGFPAETAISDRNTDYFEILVSDIPADLCRQILRDYENPIMIFVNDVRYNADTSVCDETTLNDMGFIYKNDLGTHEACSEKGYFDEEDFQCHCSGNTYLDIYTNDCLCPAGHVWSAGEGTCIESICPEGQFESLTAGCVPCSDERIHQLSSGGKALCESCPNRVYLPTYGWCVPKETCPLGTAYWTGQPAAYCARCGTVLWVDQKSDYSKQGCETCPNMYVNGSRCVNSKTCDKNQFKNLTGNCIDCDTVDSVDIGTHPNHQKLCLDCGNRGIINDTYCVKTTCSETEFMGANGRCYTCSEANAITVNTNSGCETETCGREIADGKCRLKSCPIETHVRLSDGSCFECAGTKSFNSTKAECDTCVERGWYGAATASPQTKALCLLKCEKGISYPADSNGECIKCTQSGSRYCGPSDYSKEYCEACSGAHRAGDFCMMPETCLDKRGSHFRVIQDWSYIHCYTCDSVKAYNIGTHESERALCAACTTKPRFWIGEYCYRCDSPETPDVTSTDEEKSCRTCDEREVKDGKCVLVQ